MKNKNKELKKAVFEDNLQKVKEMLNKGIDINIALYWAACGGDADIVKLLLNKGANPNAKDKDGCTALMFAAEWGHIDIVKLLLDKGAAPNVKNNDGETALDWATRNDYPDIVKLLKQHGAM